MTNSNAVQTAWQGWLDLTDEIDDDAIYGFRHGGCAHLAWKLYQMIPGARLVLFLESESGGECLTEDELYEAWGHAGVIVPGFVGVLDIGGFDAYDDESYRVEAEWNDPETFVEMIVEDCPPQDSLTVDFFAHKVIHTYLGGWKGLTIHTSSDRVSV